MAHQYEFELDFIRTWVSQPISPTRRNEEILCRMLRELSVRLTRVHLDGNNSLWVDRLADQLEDALRNVRQKIRAHEEKYGCAPQDGTDLTGEEKTVWESE